MTKLNLGGKRKGSILATSISLTAVFLTLVVGSMVYVQNTMTQARSERLRTSAEEAARSGLELVLGWAEANIDQETRLPKAWDSMRDGDIIDPVGQILENTTAGGATISTALNPGDVVGTANQNEYVVGKQGQYITTFKARIQQFRLSEDMPRQYRIGVVGRVRKVQPASRVINGSPANNIDQNERESIIAERVIVATVGKEVTSRYAALIDIDGVRNWVPGEVVTGPVHINRGYVDQAPFNTMTANIANDASPVAGVPWRDLRSTMMLYIEGQPGNVGFKAPPGGQRYPIFESQVSLTEIPGGSTDYKPADPAVNAPPIAIKINGYNYHKDNLNAQPIMNLYHDKIFLAGENTMANRYGFSGSFYRGPLIVNQPIELPRSVRNSLGSAVGMPGGFAGAGRFENLANGIYVPTPRFWDATVPVGSAPPGDSYAPAPSNTPQAPVGGIYVRGEVECMRMGKGVGARSHLSYYLFQVSNGVGSTNAKRSVYLVLADRAEKRLLLHKFPNAIKRIHGGLLPTGSNSTLQSVMGQAGLSAGQVNASSWAATGGAANPAAFAAGDGAAATFIFGAPLYSEFPFNGVIYVDTVQTDPARPATAFSSMATTGNILALGNLGSKTNPGTNKTAYAIDGVIGDVVATYKGTDPKGPASKLTILARGNIFIQNHLLVDGVFSQYKIEAAQTATNGGNVGTTTAVGGARAALSKIKIDHTRDLLGLVADKQIVVGAAAPRPTDTPTSGDKDKAGVVIMASIAALGDPAYQPWSDSIRAAYLSSPLSYIGAFSTEGLMQAYNQLEEYYISKMDGPAVLGGGTNLTNHPNLYSSNPRPTGATYDMDRTWPGNPIYAMEGYGSFNTLAGNPNIQGTRGRMIVFGSITQKKRGIVGQGNQSYDKDFVYDKRLLTIAPPIFPASVNVLVRTQSPFSPDSTDRTRALTYASGGTIKKKGDLDFLGATPAGATPAP